MVSSSILSFPLIIMALRVFFLTGLSLAKTEKLHRKNGKNRVRNKVVFAEFFSIYFAEGRVFGREILFNIFCSFYDFNTLEPVLNLF
jgi:hypothetical protein